LSSASFAAFTVSKLAIQTEGEIIDGEPFGTVSLVNGVLVNGELGTKYIVSSGTCSYPGLTVGFHKTGDCDQNFAMVTCQGGKFETVIRLHDKIVNEYTAGELSVSEYPTGFWVPNKCFAGASIKIK
jgi:hypothetical protein